MLRLCQALPIANKTANADVCGLRKISGNHMRKFIRGFRYAYQGLIYAFSTQINFRVHVFSAAIAVLLGVYFELSHSEWIWIASAILLVLIVELLNTAIEVLVDLVSPDYHPKAGIVKDVSAGAVLLTAMFAVMVGLLIFVPKIL